VATLNHRDLVEFKNPFLLQGKLVDYVAQLDEMIAQALSNQRPLSVIRLGDGEAFFLQGRLHGNIGARHVDLKKNKEFDLSEWRKRLGNNEMLCFDILWSLRSLWVPIFGEKVQRDFFPLNAVYAWLAGRKLFNRYKGLKIGLIGAEPKLDLIRRLITYVDYQSYLGINGFHSYLSVPQVGACSDADLLVENLVRQIRDDPADLYLLGMGIAKIYVQSELKNRTKKIFIDVGCGLDALAGIVPLDRPSFAAWTNYRLREFDYAKIDQLAWKLSPLMKNRYRFNPPVVL
jgi:hypothetical protein